MKVFDQRIDEIQNDEDEYFVYLKYGYQINEGWYHDHQHCFGATSKRDIQQQLKDVTPCTCESCTRGIDEIKGRI